MEEEVEQFVIDVIGVSCLDVGLLEVVLVSAVGKRWVGLGLLVDMVEDEFDLVEGDLLIFGKVSEYFVDFIVRHSILKYIRIVVKLRSNNYIRIVV